MNLPPVGPAAKPTPLFSTKTNQSNGHSAATARSNLLGFPSPQPIPQASSSSTIAYIERKSYEKYMDLFLIPDKSLWHESSLLQPKELITLLFNEIEADKSILTRDKAAISANPQVYVEQLLTVLQQYHHRITAKTPLRISHKEILYLWQLYTHSRYLPNKDSAKPLEDQIEKLVILMISKLSLEQKGQLVRFVSLSDYHRDSCNKLRAIVKKELYNDINSTLECMHKSHYPDWLSTQNILELCIENLDGFKYIPELSHIIKEANFPDHCLALRKRCQNWLNQLKEGEEVHLPKYFVNLCAYTNHSINELVAAAKSGRSLYPAPKFTFSGVSVDTFLDVRYLSHMLALPFFLEWRKSSHILTIGTRSDPIAPSHTIKIEFKDQIPICAFDSFQKPIHKHLLLFSDKPEISKSLKLSETVQIFPQAQSQLLAYYLQKFTLLIPKHFPDLKLTFSERYKEDKVRVSQLYRSILPHTKNSGHTCREQPAAPKSAVKTQTAQPLKPSQANTKRLLTDAELSLILKRPLRAENAQLIFESLLSDISKRELSDQELNFLRIKVMTHPQLPFAKQILDAWRKTKHPYNSFLSRLKLSGSNNPSDIQSDNEKFTHCLENHLKTIKASTKRHSPESSTTPSTSTSTSSTKHSSSPDKQPLQKKLRASPVQPAAPAASPPSISANQSPIVIVSPPIATTTSTTSISLNEPTLIPASLVSDYCTATNHLDLLYAEHPELNPWHPEGEGIQLELDTPIPNFSSERFFGFCADAPHIAQKAIQRGFLKGFNHSCISNFTQSNADLIAIKKARESQLAEIQQLFGLDNLPPPLRHTWGYINCMKEENDQFFGTKVGVQPFLVYNFKSVQTLLYKYALATRTFLQFDSDPRSTPLLDELKNAKDSSVHKNLSQRFLSIMAYFILEKAEQPKEEELVYSDFVRCQVPGSSYVVKIGPDTFDRCNFNLDQRAVPNEPLLVYRVLKKLNREELASLPYHLQKETPTTNKRLMVATQLLLEMANAILMRYFSNQDEINAYFQETLKINPLLSNEPLLKVLEGTSEAQIQKLPSYASSIITLPAK